MNIDRANDNPDARENAINRIEKESSIPNDLPDSERDSKELESEEIIINLPDVKDIPGQEFVNVPPMNAIGDTTISSSDEEGGNIFDEDENDIRSNRNDSSVSRGEKIALQDTNYLPTHDEDNLRDASQDSTDFDGDPLNERSFGDERSHKE
jgi:hypothetical protein